MSKLPDIVTAIEFGTSKITVFTGECNGASAPQIIGYSSQPARGVISKGEIRDAESAVKLLGDALRAVAADSGRPPEESAVVAVLVDGCGVSSQLGIGTAKARESLITEEVMAAAYEEAKVLNLAADREIINSAGARCRVDGQWVSNPLNHSGTTLETHVHIVHAISSRVRNFREVVNTYFAPETVEVIFSPLAADIGILSEEERKNGVLLIDIGAGCTDYVVEYDGGIRSSGSLQVGFDHVANDLALAFGLHINTCRRLLQTGKLDEFLASGSEALEITSTANKLLAISRSDLLAVIDARLEEIFAIIKRHLAIDKVPQELESGGVITGGGAKFSRTREMFQKVFDRLDCTVRCPADVDGAVTVVKDPAFSAVWGALKYSAYRAENSAPATGSFRDCLATFAEGVWEKTCNFFRAFKF